MCGGRGEMDGVGWFVVDLEVCGYGVVEEFALVMGWCVEAAYYLVNGDMRFANMVMDTMIGSV